MPVFVLSLVNLVIHILHSTRSEGGMGKEGREREKDVRKGTAPQPPPKLVVCLGT